MGGGVLRCASWPGCGGDGRRAPSWRSDELFLGLAFAASGCLSGCSVRSAATPSPGEVAQPRVEPRGSPRPGTSASSCTWPARPCPLFRTPDRRRLQQLETKAGRPWFVERKPADGSVRHLLRVDRVDRKRKIMAFSTGSIVDAAAPCGPPEVESRRRDPPRELELRQPLRRFHGCRGTQGSAGGPTPGRPDDGAALRDAAPDGVAHSRRAAKRALRPRSLSHRRRRNVDRLTTNFYTEQEQIHDGKMNLFVARAPRRGSPWATSTRPICRSPPRRTSTRSAIASFTASSAARSRTTSS